MGQAGDQETELLLILKEAKAVEEGKKLHNNTISQVGRQQETVVGRAGPAQLRKLPRNRMNREDGPTVAVTNRLSKPNQTKHSQQLIQN